MWLVAGVVGYLIGSVSFARIVGHWRAPGTDLSIVEYEIPGSDEVWTYRGVSATSVAKRIGFRWGLLVAGLDMAKGLVPTLVTRMAWPDQSWYLVLGLTVVMGHVWPIYHRFRGGRGQSTLIGSVLAASPIALPVAIVAGTIMGLLLLTSGYLARQGFGCFVWVWPLIREGPSADLTFGISISIAYLIAIWPDVQEERRVKGSLIGEGRYSQRFSHAWAELTSDE